MMERNFRKMLEAKWLEGKDVCVGLDVDLDKVPEEILVPSIGLGSTWDHRPDVNSKLSIIRFNKRIIYETKNLVLAYKLNLAFYGRHWTDGFSALYACICHIREVAPDVPIILDAKIGDVRHTNEKYAEIILDHLGVDAVTLNPYMGGEETFKPFLERSDKGVIFLCKTSNEDSGEFQDQQVLVRPDEMNYPGVSKTALGEPANPIAYTVPFYKVIADRVRHWDTKYGNCAIVFGATYSHELGEIRNIVGDMPILVPGIETQSGDLEGTVHLGQDSRGHGLIISASRSIVFSHDPRGETMDLQRKINEHRCGSSLV